MKKQISNTLKAILLLVVFSLSSCGSDDSDSPNIIEQLSQTWHLQELVVDGVTYSNDISLYQLILKNDMTYVLTDLTGITANGNWTLANDDNTLRLDQEEFTIVAITKETLNITGSSNSSKTGLRALDFRLITL